MKRNDSVGIQECIDRIHRRGLYGPLQTSVQEAERLMLAISKMDRLKVSTRNRLILAISKMKMRD